MIIRPIKTNDDYKYTLLRIDALMDAEPGTQDGAELDVLVTLVEAYENEHFTISPPDPVAAILFRMEQTGFKR